MRSGSLSSAISDIHLRPKVELASHLSVVLLSRQSSSVV